MLKAGKGNEDFVGMLLDMTAAVWEERMVPREWMDAVIPICKKGKLSGCDSWWGIALLEVVGKVAARVTQERLQRELPDSQCGFRKGRSCTAMTFVVRQLTEKALEHRMKQFNIFIDLTHLGLRTQKGSVDGYEGAGSP